MSLPIWNLRSLSGARRSNDRYHGANPLGHHVWGSSTAAAAAGGADVGAGWSVRVSVRRKAALVAMCVPAASVILASVPCPQPTPVNFQVIDFVVTPG